MRANVAKFDAGHSRIFVRSETIGEALAQVVCHHLFGVNTHVTKYLEGAQIVNSRRVFGMLMRDEQGIDWEKAQVVRIIGVATSHFAKCCGVKGLKIQNLLAKVSATIYQNAFSAISFKQGGATQALIARVG
jgi:hypothetical protein